MSKILDTSGVEYHVIFLEEEDKKPFLILDGYAFPFTGVVGANFLATRLR